MAVNESSIVSRIEDQSGVGEARRAALGMAAAAGFDETDAGKLGIAVTEAAANVLHHGNGGEILLRRQGAGIELLALDKGPGIANLQHALEDGRSTAGTSGIGLGAISRLASAFDIYTAEGHGTALVAWFYPALGRRNCQAPEPAALESGVVQSLYPGELCCGDAWAACGNALLVVDGLGHGFQAAQAAAAAVAAFQDNWRRSARDTIEAIHLALRPTRGAAVAVVKVDPDRRVVHFSGVGNISGAIVSAGSAHGMMSHNGIAGHEVERIAQLEYAWMEGDLVILQSDGIRARWDLGAYPGLALRHPLLVAAVLYRDFHRTNDDATIVVARGRPAGREAV